MEEFSLAGLSFRVGRLDHSASLTGSVVSHARVEAYGGAGSVEIRSSLWKDRELDVNLARLDLGQVCATLGHTVPALAGVKVRGTVGKLTVAIRGDRVRLEASAFRVAGDPVKKIEVDLNKKTGAYTAKVHALGGLAELSGTIPVPQP